MASEVKNRGIFLGAVMADAKKMEEVDEALEQGFNDQELEDIMNEIESLEEEFTESNGEQAAPSQPEETKEEVVQQKEQDNVVSFKQESNKSEAMSAPVASNKSSASTGSAANTQMDFHLQGEMRLDMSFTVDGKKVFLTVGGAEGLVIEMGDGGKFVLPLGTSHKKTG